eukprot:5999771-Amphidinium_carterae.2
MACASRICEPVHGKRMIRSHSNLAKKQGERPSQASQVTTPLMATVLNTQKELQAHLGSKPQACNSEC